MTINTLVLLLLLSAALPITVMFILALVKRREPPTRPPRQVVYIIPLVDSTPGQALLEAPNENAANH